jgi:CubicO group peptidase (beta-lactamase class C family)
VLPAPLPRRSFVDATAQRSVDAARHARVSKARAPIRRLIEGAMQDNTFPGVALGVVLGDTLLFSDGFGLADLDAKRPVDGHTVFRIASITKTFTGVALLQLRDAGELSFEVPASRYLPALARVRYPTRDSPHITLRHLVTHTSGIPRLAALDYSSGRSRAPSEKDLGDALDGLTLERPPGTRVIYSNLGAATAGLVLARVSGRKASDYIDSHVLQPLGMSSTQWSAAAVDRKRLATGYLRRADGRFRSVDAHWQLGAAAPIGGLYSSVHDMARYLAFQLSAWPPRDEPEGALLARATMREAQLVMGPAIPGQKGFGTFWVSRHDPALGLVVGHSGSTALYSAVVRMLPHRNMAIVLLANSGNVASRRLDELARQALLELLDADPVQEPTLSPQLEAAVKTVRQLLIDPEPALISARFAARFLESVPAEDIAKFFRQRNKSLGLCKAHQVLRRDGEHAAVVRLFCAEGELRVSVHVDGAPPHHIVGLLLDAKSQQQSPATQF